MLFIAGIFVSTCKKNDDPGYSAMDLLIKDLNEEIRSDSIESYVRWLENMGTRFALSEKRRETAIRIRNKLISFGYGNASLDSFMISKSYNATLYQLWQYNVVATLEGSGSSDSVTLIGAHYDNNLISGDPFSTVPGANDNASGVAVTLEIARVMKTNGYIPDGNIRFMAFAAEELGLYGSLNYAGKAKDNHEKIRMMLNNDMVAYQKLADRTGWVVNIVDYPNSYTLRTKAQELCTKFTGLKYKTDNTYYRQSDSYSFYTNGFKALFFFSDVVDPNYHTLNDLASNCNFEYCREIAKLNCTIAVNAN
jgi:leucyl aminopeptidase